MRTYHTPLDLVRERSPERPVALVRPDAVALAARWFQDNFKGDVLYAVKANPSPWVIETLWNNGVRGFDVASIPEIELVAGSAPGHDGPRGRRPWPWIPAFAGMTMWILAAPSGHPPA